MIFYGCQLQGSFLFFHAALCSATMNAVCEWGWASHRLLHRQPEPPSTPPHTPATAYFWAA